MVYFPRPMHAQPAFEGASLCPDGYPVTEQLCGTVLSLPIGPYLKDKPSKMARQLAKSCE